MYKAIGMLEVSSIGKGMYANDLMSKASEIDIITSGSVCPGKYISIISGDVAAVQNAVSVGVRASDGAYVDSVVIPNVHPGIFPAVTGTTMPQHCDALGIVESFSLAFMIRIADIVLKAAAVEAIELRLGSGLGGKAYFTFTGNVGAVEASVKAAVEECDGNGILVDTEVIPKPSAKFWATLF
ncbi:MAG: BMC domain-containing protein [Megasphaera sp.]|jgi:microcompartment protein CcmL/EutN|nr:BMC domain-containing protein [Megasphaera sp.]